MSRVSDKPYFLYVLWSDAARRFYIGISDDALERLAQHNACLSKWTSKFGPWRLVHMEEFGDYTAARKRELFLKRQKGGGGFYKQLGKSFEELTGPTTLSGS